MTVVIARRFGKRIVVAADTMISDHKGSPPQVFPGQLKAIVLSRTISVAFAGTLLRSLDIVRQAKTLVQRGLGLPSVLEHLRSESTDGSCDFIVASHCAGPEIYKVTNGVVSGALNCGWIGNADSVHHFSLYDNLSHSLKSPEGISQEELQFRLAFQNAFMNLGIQISTGVGGVPIFLLASPYGHCYDNYGFAVAWDVIDLAVGNTPRHCEDRKAGMTEWKITGCASSWRGAAIFGIYLEQPSIDFLYDPLAWDSVDKYKYISRCS